MRFTTVVNLPVIVLALAVGAAALPAKVWMTDNDPITEPMAGPSHIFFFQHFVS